MDYAQYDIAVAGTGRFSRPVGHTAAVAGADVLPHPPNRPALESLCFDGDLEA